MSIFNNVSALGLTKYKAAGKPNFKGWVNAIADFVAQKFTDEDTLEISTYKDSSVIGDGKSPAFLCVKTLYYTAGVRTTTGVDYNFVSAADHAEQSIRLGGGDIIPANSRVIDIFVRCTENLSTGAATATVDVGESSGGNEYLSAGDVDDADEFVGLTAGAAPLAAALNVAASSVYFSVDPNTNWDDASMVTGKWAIWITYIDGSDVS